MTDRNPDIHCASCKKYMYSLSADNYSAKDLVEVYCKKCEKKMKPIKSKKINCSECGQFLYNLDSSSEDLGLKVTCGKRKCFEKLDKRLVMKSNKKIKLNCRGKAGEAEIIFDEDVANRLYVMELELRAMMEDVKFLRKAWSTKTKDEDLSDDARSAM